MDEDLVEQIRLKYEGIQERMIRAAQSANRAAESIRLVVVSKTQPMDIMQAAIHAGVRRFGENYAEEAVEKIQTFAAVGDLEWHMIGHVQTRKARLVGGNFHRIHSLDSLKLAGRLNAAAVTAGKVLPALLEFNLAGEKEKTGFFAPTETEWTALIPEISGILELPNLRVDGLMTMPPLFDNPELARPYFAQLMHLRDWLSIRFPRVNWVECSMGTSSDFEVAIQEGATFIRVGTAILGPRHYAKPV
ncbi:MAG: YggS family pyridoxal phosphate-dependent enzyme [Anaerolineaceae bacterium]